MQPNVLISQDLSCMGQVSLGVALPLLGACGFQPTVLPTALLSTHTGGFGANSYLDLSTEMIKILQHWEQLTTKFDAVYLGYLGAQPLDVLLEHLPRVCAKDCLFLVDPVMGDHEKLYRGFDDHYVAQMRQLVKKASLVTPNLTEAKLLLGMALKPTTSPVTLAEAQKIARQLAIQFEIPHVVLTGLDLAENQIGVVGYQLADKLNWEIVQPKLPGNFFGTGDLFASVLLAGILRGYHVKSAAQIAMDFISQAITQTPANHDLRYGINYASAMVTLLNRLEKKKGITNHA